MNLNRKKSIKPIISTILIIIIILLLLFRLFFIYGNDENESPNQLDHIEFKFEYGHYPTDIEWRPDGKYALIVGQYGTLYKYDGKTIQNLTYLTNGWDHLNHIYWHPYKKEAFLVGGQSYLYTDNAEPELTKIDNISYGAWKPDGEYALMLGPQWVWKYYSDNLSEKILPIVLVDNIERPLMRISFKEVAWKPDGSEAIISDYIGYIFKFKEDKLFEISNEITNGTWYYDIVWKPDGSEAILVGENGKIVRYKDEKFEDISGYFDKRFEISSLTWEPNGDYCIIISEHDWTCKGMLVVKYDGQNYYNYSNLQYKEVWNCKKIRWRPNFNYCTILSTKGDDLKFYLINITP